MSHYNFEFPYIFLLLPLIIFCQIKCPGKGDTIYFPYIHHFFHSTRIKNIWIEIFKWLSIIFILLALASPVKVTTLQNTQYTRDIMLILDSSESMLSKGFDDKHILKSKFDGVIEVIEEFIKKRKNDRIGLITFANSAFIASPLTLDKKYLKDIVKKQRVGLVGKKSAIYDSVIKAIYLLQNNKSKNKIIILLTDGKDNMSIFKFEDILKFLKKTKIKLYVIGVANKKELNTKKLSLLAKAGGGKFFVATNKNNLEKIYQEIDKIEKSKEKAKIYQVYTYYYYYPLILSLIFLIFYIYLKSVKGIAK